MKGQRRRSRRARLPLSATASPARRNRRGGPGRFWPTRHAHARRRLRDPPTRRPQRDQLQRAPNPGLKFSPANGACERKKSRHERPRSCRAAKRSRSGNSAPRPGSIRARPTSIKSARSSISKKSARRAFGYSPPLSAGPGPATSTPFSSSRRPRHGTKTGPIHIRRAPEPAPNSSPNLTNSAGAVSTSALHGRRADRFGIADADGRPRRERGDRDPGGRLAVRAQQPCLFVRSVATSCLIDRVAFCMASRRTILRRLRGSSPNGGRAREVFIGGENRAGSRSRPPPRKGRSRLPPRRRGGRAVRTRPEGFGRFCRDAPCPA